MPRFGRNHSLYGLLATILLGVLSCRGADLGPFRLKPLASIGADSGVGAIPTWPRVSARHPGGFRVVVPQPGQSDFLPLVYDDGGNFAGVLTATGAGPAGFVQPGFARFGPGDSIWVFDAANRVLVFDPARRYQRTVRLPFAPWDAVVLGDSRLAITSSAYGSPLPWLLLDGDGTVLRRVGTADSTDSSPRRIVVGQDGSIWTVPMTRRLVLEHWDTTGTLLERFEPNTSWFPPRNRGDTTSESRAPQSSVQGAWIGADGEIWILGKVADSRWQEGMSERSTGTEAILHPDQVYDTVIETRDPRTGALIGSARFDQSYPFAPEPGVVMRPVVIEGGWFRAELATVQRIH